MTTALTLIPWVMKLLVGSGLIKDPEQEHEVRLRLLDAATRKDIAESEEFVAFLKATSPDSAHVWPFINSLQAATRPLLTWIITGSIIASFIVPGLAERVTATLQAFADAGTAGLLFIAIPAWWFFGRSIEKIVPGMALLRGHSGENHHGHESVMPPLGRIRPAPAAQPPTTRLLAAQPPAAHPPTIHER